MELGENSVVKTKTDNSASSAGDETWATTGTR